MFGEFVLGVVATILVAAACGYAILAHRPHGQCRCLHQLALRRLSSRRSWTQQTTGWQYTMTKVGKSDREGTFAGTAGNDGNAPKPVIPAAVNGRRGSTP